MKRAYRVFRWSMLVASVITLVVALHRPRTYVVPPVSPATQAKHAQDFSDKLQQLETAKERGEDARANITSEEITSAITQALMQQGLPGAQAAPAGQSGAVGQAASSPGQGTASQVGYGSDLASDPNAAIAAGDVNVGQIKEPLVTFEGDEVKGRFLTNVHGKDVYITISGHLGSKDGYVTFDPTGFQVGDLPVPVSLVNPALQQKLADPENRDKLKLPDFISGLHVENGQLIVDEKK